ncbi:DUF6125 family protein [Chloroflexota bacterium]
MDRLPDYAGEFNPDIKREDFSRELLIEALDKYGQYAYMIDAFWYLGVKGKRGVEEASFYNRQTIDKSLRYEIEMIKQLYNIQGDDVTSLMKFQQVRPMASILKAMYEIRNPHQGIYTITNCPVLENMEREGKGRERIICHIDHVEGAALIASLFNPGMKGIPLKLPPRKSRDEVCCQWEFSLDV